MAVAVCVPLRADDNTAPAEIQAGERLANEIRFTHFFAVNSKGDVNAALREGDPSQDYADSTSGPVTGAFAGLANNCRSCHPATEYHGVRGNRAYADMAARSPIERREDGRSRTVRNSQAFVDIGAEPEEYPLFHYDGEFTSLRSLVVGTMSGRNYGWLPREREEALKHIVCVIREDDASEANQPAAGGPYASLFGGGEEVAARLRLPPRYRLDVKTATDAQILERVGELVEAYMLSLRFSRDDSGTPDGSPYDAFLEANALPRRPGPGESPRAYAGRLRAAVDALKSPVFVDDPERTMATFARPKPFRFGPGALAGLKVFLKEPDPARPGVSGVGNCVACHVPPSFTDARFHNTGVTQAGYDAVHGPRAFANLAVPSLAERARFPDKYLPPSPRHPDAVGRFLAIPKKYAPGFTDLGVWNVFANPDLPESQPALRRALSAGRSGVDDARLLDEAVARFRTPTLRLLGQSEPYMHDGAFPTLASVVAHYRDFFDLAARGCVRNPAPEMIGPKLDDADAAALVEFLESLNEDYE